MKVRSPFVTIAIGTLTIPSAVFLGWFADMSLAATWFREPAGEQRWTIRAASSVDRNPKAENACTSVVTISRHGTKIWPDQIELQGEWRVDNAPHDATYSHGPADSRPATLAFAATDAALRLGRSSGGGRATILRNGEPESTVDLYRATPNDDTAYVDLPRFDVPWWSLPAHVGACCLLLLLLRPWSSQRGFDVWSAFYTFALQGLVWATHPVAGNEDTTGYLGCLPYYAHGFTTYFPPGYCLFFEGLRLVCPLGLGGAATLVQHLMMAASLLMLMDLLHRYTPPALTSAWLLVTATLFPIVYLPQALMSETLALFGMASALWLGRRAAETGSIARSMLSGLVMGIAALARAVPLATLPALWLAAIGVRAARPGPRSWAIAAAVAIAVVAVPILWFGLHSGEFNLTNGDGLHLYNRTVVEQRLVDHDGKATREILSHVSAAEMYQPHWDIRSTLETRAGMDSGTSNKLVSHAAYEAIRAHPTDYLLFSFPLACRDLFANPSWLVARDANFEERMPEVETPPVLACGTGSLAARDRLYDWFGAVQPALPWLFIAGTVLALFLRARWLALALAFVPLAYLLATGFVEFFLERYVAAVMPFMAAVALTPFTLLARALGWRGPSGDGPAAP